MSPNFAQAFEAEFAAVETEIATERSALENQDDRELSERSRIRIRFLERQLRAIEAAHASILSAAGEVQSMPLRWDRWRALCRSARAAKDEKDALEKQLDPARNEVSVASNDVAHAEHNLATHRNKPLPQYATQKEIHRHEAEEKRLIEVHAVAMANIQRLAGVRDDIERACLDARSRFEGLMFQERMSRLPDEPDAATATGKAWVSAAR